LFNALVGRERAIVTEVPGTTRDAIEAAAVIEGFPFRLVDTAGLRASEDRIERLGIEVSRKYLTAADLILFCDAADEGRGSGNPGERATFLPACTAPVGIVRTKADLLPIHRPPSPVPAVSAVTGEWLDALEGRVAWVAAVRR